MSSRGILQLTLKSANELYKHDLFGKQQPYCQIDCGRYRVKGKTCKDGGQNPTWGETLFFQVSTETEVTVTVFAEHSLSKDTRLGSAVISIVQVRQTGSEDVSVPLSLKGKQAGTLHVTMEFKGPHLAAYGQVGTAYGQVAAGGDAGGGRRALQGSRPSIFGSASSSFSASSGTGQLQPLQPLRLASIPIRLLQQHGSTLLQAQQQHAAAVSSHMPQPQKQQSPNQQPAHQPFAGALRTSTSLTQQAIPQSTQDAALEARELLLQRQLSTPILPADMAALQQLYSQQLQQLQLLQTQLLGNIPVELQQQQQQNLLWQQQLLSQVATQRTGSGSSQRDGLQQRSSSGGGSNNTTAAAAAALQLPRQPKRTAADLFQPDSHGINRSAASFDQLLNGSTGLGDEDLLNNESDMLLSASSSVPFSFDNMARLQAIIQKVYPDRSVSSIWGQTNKQGRDHHQPNAQGLDESTAAAAAAPAVQQGSMPNSTGAFGATAALAAAAAAAGIDVDSRASGRANLSNTPAAASQPAAAAATTAPRAAAAKQAPSGGSGSAAPNSTGAFGAAAALAAAAAAAGTETDSMGSSSRDRPSSSTAPRLGQRGVAGSPAVAAKQASAPSASGACRAAAAGIEPQPTGTVELQPCISATTPRANVQHGMAAAAAVVPPSQAGFTPNSTGAFVTAAALAAAMAAAGLATDSTYGDTHAANKNAATTAAACTAVGTEVHGLAGSAGELLAAQHMQHQQQQQTSLETSTSATSAQSAPPGLAPCSMPAELISTSSGNSTTLAPVMSAPPLGLLTHAPGAAGSFSQDQHQQQVVLSPDVSAVLAEELTRLKMAAPVWTQLLGLEMSQPAMSAAAHASARISSSGNASSSTTRQQTTGKWPAAAAPVPTTPSPVVASVGEAAMPLAPLPSTPSPVAESTGVAAAPAAAHQYTQPRAAASSSGCCRSAEELVCLLEASEKGKADLSKQLQERDLLVQQLRSQLFQQQEVVERLQQRLAQQQPHH